MSSTFRVNFAPNAPLFQWIDRTVNRVHVLAGSLALLCIALNGLVILVPGAPVLALWAQAGRFGGWFYGVQALELVAGAVNLVLMGRNLRDGLRLTGRLGRSA
ncbi:hypothetical protein [Rhodovibrio sodomensis]|uniref:hypothetical protein n=1 Tax=Rhodovibrio sodomensis TaxID=1088 RepID=UPI0019035785|nr:hypothetical protein [Rhodovibrio sodomensis]